MALEITDNNFKEILAEGKPVVIDFWAPWCGYCRRIGPALEKVASERDDIIVARINIDEEPQLASAANIEVIPTLIIYEGGRSIASVTAPGSKAAIDRFIDDSLK